MELWALCAKPGALRMEPRALRLGLRGLRAKPGALQTELWALHARPRALRMELRALQTGLGALASSQDQKLAPPESMIVQPPTSFRRVASTSSSPSGSSCPIWTSPARTRRRLWTKQPMPSDKCFLDLTSASPRQISPATPPANPFKPLVTSKTPIYGPTTQPQVRTTFFFESVQAMSQMSYATPPPACTSRPRTALLPVAEASRVPLLRKRTSPESSMTSWE